MARKISEATAAVTVAGTEELPANQSGAGKKITVNQIKTFVAAAPASHASQHAAAGADPVTLAQSQVTNLTTDLAGKKADSMATGKLLGRGTAGTGVIEEITLGTNLSLTGTTLNAAGGSGSGDVTGPSSAGDGNLTVFDGITGKIVKDGGAITAAGKALLDDATAADQRTTLGLGGAAVLNVGTTTGTVAAGDDSRLSDSRTPVSHASSHNAGGGDALAIDAAAGTGSLRTLGTSATSACSGSDSRLSDARTPTAHASSHASAGSDAVKIDDLAAADDNTDLNATTSAHGLLPKLGGGTTNFLRADGTWAAPSGSSSPLTTKGDIYSYSTADARLAVGTNGQFLRAQSGETTGLKWETMITVSTSQPSGTAPEGAVWYVVS